MKGRSYYFRDSKRIWREDLLLTEIPRREKTFWKLQRGFGPSNTFTLKWEVVFFFSRGTQRGISSKIGSHEGELHSKKGGAAIITSKGTRASLLGKVSSL